MVGASSSVIQETIHTYIHTHTHTHNLKYEDLLRLLELSDEDQPGGASQC